MKFWEALEAMEAGAVCECERAAGRKFRYVDGSVRHRDDDAAIWEQSTFYCNQVVMDGWRIVTPAPVDTKQDFEALSKRMDAIEERQNVNRDIDNGQNECLFALEAKPDGDAMAKRVEALERESFHEFLDGGLQSNADRISALESKIAALEASKAQPVVNVTDLHNDMAKLAQPMSLGEVAWPEGSLQWAEVEAKRLKLPRVRRTGGYDEILLSRLDRSMLEESERHALDWEPCE